MQRNKSHLHYGSLISLKLLQNGDTYIASDGFTIKSVIAQNYSDSHDGQTSIDFLDSVFLVIPLYQYEAQQMIQHKLDQFYIEETKKFYVEINSRQESNARAVVSTNETQDNAAKQELHLMNIQQELMRELSQNLVKFNKNKNMNICYGERFQLQHYRSKKYLTLSNQSFTDNYDNIYSLQLEPNPSEMSFFKFVSAYRHQPDVSKDILFNSHVYLAIDIDKEGYIYFLNSDKSADPQSKYMEYHMKEFAGESSFQQEMRHIKERKSDFYFKFVKQSIFELKLFCECIEDDKSTATQEDISTLTYGDIVWITENQTESYLECVDNIEDELIKGNALPPKCVSLSQFAVAKTKDDYDQKQKNLSQLRQKNKINLSLFFKKFQSSELKNTRGLWKIEGSTMDKGGPISLKSFIRLKNIRNGLYLAFIEQQSTVSEERTNIFGMRDAFEQKQKKQKYGIVEMQLHQSADVTSTLFQLLRKEQNTPVSTNNEYLYEFLYDIRHVQTQLYLGQMYKKEFAQTANRGNQGINLNFNDQRANAAAQSLSMRTQNPQFSSSAQTGNNGLGRQSQMNMNLLDDNIIKVDNDATAGGADNGDDYSKKMLAAVVTMPEPNTKEFIKLFKAPHEDIWEILFLLSCIPQLQRGINLLKHVQTQIIDVLKESSEERISRRIKQEADGLEKQFLQFNRLIQSIIQFCYDAKSSIQTNSAEEGKFKCNSKRQRLLREQGVLRYVTLTIQHLFQTDSPFKKALLNEDYLLQELSLFQNADLFEDPSTASYSPASFSVVPAAELKSKVLKIFKGLSQIIRSCYQLIYQICYNNVENQMQAFKYIKVYKNHIGFGVGAESCIIAIFSDNEDLLLSQNFTDIYQTQDDLIADTKDISRSQHMMLGDYQDDQQLIFGKKSAQRSKEHATKPENKLINIIFQQYDIVCALDSGQKGQVYEIIDLLNCLCKNGSEGLTINQSSICDMIFPPEMNEDIFYTRFVRIQRYKDQDSNELVVEDLMNPRQNDIKLLWFFNPSYKPNQEMEMNDKEKRQLVKMRKFIHKMVSLYASLCSDRNYNCIEKIRRILPFECIKEHLWIESGASISSALVQIADCVYIDKKPRFQKFVPDLVHSINFVNSQSRTQRVYQLLASSSVEVSDSPFNYQQQSYHNTRGGGGDELTPTYSQQGYNGNSNYSGFSNMFAAKQQGGSIMHGIEMTPYKLKTAFAKKPMYNNNGYSNYSQDFIEDESKEERNLMQYLRNHVFVTLTNYLKRCTTNSELRNQALTLNTIELIRKFLVFDIFSLTTQDNQQMIYESFLLLLQLGIDEVFKYIPHQQQSNEYTKTPSLKNEISKNNKNALFPAGQKNRVRFSPEVKEQPKGRASKPRTSRTSVHNTLVRENLSNLYRRQIQNSNENPAETMKNEKTVRQMNTDMKKKICEIFLIYVENKINSHIDRIIKYIRKHNKKMQYLDEDDIYKQMKDPLNIEEIFPKIELPIPVFDYNGKNTDLLKKHARQNSTQNHDGDSEEWYPPLNSFLKYHTAAFQALYTRQSYSTSEGSSGHAQAMIRPEQLLSNLLNLFLSNNDYNLNCLILNLIFKNFSLGKQVIKESKNLVILSSEKENEIDNKIEETIVQFSFMCETSETWFVHASKLKLLDNKEWKAKNEDEYKNLYEKRNQVYQSIQQIKDLNELMFTVSLKEMQYPMRMLHKKEVKMNRQFMMKNVNAQKLIMDMLKDNIHILEEISEYDSNCNITLVFFHCFQFLRNFCLQDNKINKKDLYNDIRFFLRFMKYVEVGQTDLINEIYKDNYKACTEVDDHIIKLYLAKICHPLSYKGYGGRHMRYLNFINSIMFFKKLKMPIKNNIWKVVQNIQIFMNSERMMTFLFMKLNILPEPKSSQYQNPSQRYMGQYVFDLTLPSLSSSSTSSQIDPSNKQNVFQQQQVAPAIYDEDFNFNQPYIYHATVLNTLLDIIKETEGKSSFLKNSLRRYLPADYLLFFMQKWDYFNQNTEKNKLVLYMKKPLCKLFLLLFGDQESLQTNQKHIIDNKNTRLFIKNEINKLKKIIDEQTTNYNQTQKTHLQSGNRISNEGSEDLGFELNQSEISLQNRQLEKLSDLICKSDLDYLTWLVGYALPVMNFIFELDEKMKNSFETDRRALEVQLTRFQLIEKINQSITLREHLLQDNIDAIRMMARKFVSKESTDSSIPLYNFKNHSSTMNSSSNAAAAAVSLGIGSGINDDLEQYVSLPLQNILSNKDNSYYFNDKYPKIFLLNMLIMEEFKEAIDLERMTFTQSILKIDRRLVDSRNSDKPSVILPHLVQFLKTAFLQYTLDKGWNEYRIMVEIMRLFISILEDPLDQIDLEEIIESKEYQSIEEQMNSQKSKKLTIYQDLLANNNLPKILLDMLCNKEIDFELHHQSIKLRRVIFLLINALLEEGNRKVQNQIYQFFTQNEQSQAFFDMISGMIDLEIKQNLNVSIYDDIEKDLESIEFVYRNRDKFMNISDVLKTIQLLCEGHFTKNQNYIRFQSNSRNSVNLIERISELFDVMIRNHAEPNKLKIDGISLMKSCQVLDTLIESIQGPVLDNQMELIQSKILKSICDVLSQEENGSSQLNSTAPKATEADKLISNLKKLSQRFARKVNSKFNKQQEEWMVAKLKNKCIQFLDSLLEGNQDSAILNKIMTEIPQSVISQNLGYVYQKYMNSSFMKFTTGLLQISYLEIDEIMQKKSQGQRERYGLILDTGFRAYHLLILYHQELTNQQRNRDNLPGGDASAAATAVPQQDLFNENIGQMQDFIVQGYEFMKNLTLHIEVNINSQFYTIYFPKLPACNVNYEQIMLKYEEKFNRVSTKSKTRDLLKYSDDIILELEHEFKIHEGNTSVDPTADDGGDPDDEDTLKNISGSISSGLQSFGAFGTKYSYTMQSISFQLALLQNLVILLSFKNYHHFTKFELGLASLQTQDVIYDDQDMSLLDDLSIIGFPNINPVDILVGILDYIQYLQIFLNLFVLAALLFRDFPYLHKRVSIHYSSHDFEQDNLIVQFIRKIPKIPFKKIHLYYLTCIEVLDEKWPDIILIFCAILALWNPVLTALLLLDVFRRKPSLKNILKSVILAKTALLLTLLLFVILTYLFSLIIYYYFWSDLPYVCSTLWTCLLYVFDRTFKSDAGYVSTFEHVFEDNWSLGINEIFQTLYTFIIIIIIAEIISGIIIDTLANLREEDEKRTNDIETVCFICGNDRDTLDRKPGGFEKHVMEDHNRMHYIFFIMYLKFKKQTDLSGFESDIKKQVDKKEINWFPILDFYAEQDGFEEKALIEKKKQELKFQEELVHSEFKEQNEKLIKDVGYMTLDVLKSKIDKTLDLTRVESEEEEEEDSDYD